MPPFIAHRTRTHAVPRFPVFLVLLFHGVENFVFTANFQFSQEDKREIERARDIVSKKGGKIIKRRANSLSGQAILPVPVYRCGHSSSATVDAAKAQKKKNRAGKHLLLGYNYLSPLVMKTCEHNGTVSVFRAMGKLLFTRAPR